MGDGIKLDDEEFERLEEIRRHGDRCHGDDEDDNYYTLPPRRTGLMHEWTSWRTHINEIMCDAIAEHPSPGEMKRERDMLTSPTETKTPKFFRDKMSVYGQKVKDQYGGPVIEENDDIATRHEKKMMEGNFYLFGIPRISVGRCFEKQCDTPGSHTNLRHLGSSKRGRSGSFEVLTPEINASRRDLDTYATSDKRSNKGLVRSWSVTDERPRMYNSRSFSQFDIPNIPLNRNAYSASGSGWSGHNRRFAYVTSSSNKQHKMHAMRKGQVGTEMVFKDERFS